MGVSECCAASLTQTVLLLVLLVSKGIETLWVPLP